MLMFEYMKGSYDIVDDAILEDFKHSSYKAYAFTCGHLLASCVSAYGTVPEPLTEITKDLSRGV